MFPDCSLKLDSAKQTSALGVVKRWKKPDDEQVPEPQKPQNLRELGGCHSAECCNREIITVNEKQNKGLAKQNQTITHKTLGR